MNVMPVREWVRVTLVRRDGGASSSQAALELTIRCRSVLECRPLKRRGQAEGVRVSPRVLCKHVRVGTYQLPPSRAVSALRCPSHQSSSPVGHHQPHLYRHKMCIGTFFGRRRTVLIPTWSEFFQKVQRPKCYPKTVRDELPAEWSRGRIKRYLTGSLGHTRSGGNNGWPQSMFSNQFEFRTYVGS